MLKNCLTKKEYDECLNFNDETIWYRDDDDTDEDDDDDDASTLSGGEFGCFGSIGDLGTGLMFNIEDSMFEPGASITSTINPNEGILEPNFSLLTTVPPQYQSYYQNYYQHPYQQVYRFGKFSNRRACCQQQYRPMIAYPFGGVQPTFGGLQQQQLPPQKVYVTNEILPSFYPKSVVVHRQFKNGVPFFPPEVIRKGIRYFDPQPMIGAFGAFGVQQQQQMCMPGIPPPPPGFACVPPPPPGFVAPPGCPQPFVQQPFMQQQPWQFVPQPMGRGIRRGAVRQQQRQHQQLIATPGMTWYASGSEKRQFPTELSRNGQPKTVLVVNGRKWYKVKNQ